ncbi:hypothetical protein [Lysobacter silvisoli]|uniref:Uncharacterized protein n=1 Tax=Lysobacter silvisoli TaxID=2293254 RepID=A0A371K485_9GAMM|nr:hypothetical protein [Lysobacter silvisoli]RDZ28674.1 hypothetical protein DX914_05985 [Lysobacter silvisoli]
MSLYDIFSPAKRDAWAMAIGRVMVAAAQLEGQVWNAVLDTQDEALLRLARKSPNHANLLDLLEGTLSERSEQMRRQGRTLLDALRDYNRQRNHIAHNTRHYAVDAHTRPEDRYGAIVDRRQPRRRIGLQEVQALAEQGEALSLGFWPRWQLLNAPWMDAEEDEQAPAPDDPPPQRPQPA